jgi:hypothetical protein
MTIDPGITEELPLVLAARAVASAYTSAGVLTDINIGGLPFFLACKDDQPYVRETNDYKREQIDTSPDPGEQTLSQWWVRDQDSWHHGAGILYYEPGPTRPPATGWPARGVDVWTRGQATLLKKTNLLQSAAGACYATGARVSSGADVIFGLAGGTVFRHDGTTKTNFTGAPWTPSTPLWWRAATSSWAALAESCTAPPLDPPGLPMAGCRPGAALVGQAAHHRQQGE